ncbi:CAP domain-containing protein [Deinococcus aluminii]|uniref:SCP domain-containing protein n=1 Tax=Deinococcus aluminii TaxID=1656885 RepID=A0ABP9XER7_9DEIO
MRTHTLIPAALTLSALLAACTGPSVPGNGDTQAPTLALTVPATVTPGATIKLQASAQDNVGITRVEFYDASGQLLGTDTTPPYEWVTAAPANTGSSTLTVNFTVKAYDAAGNVGTKTIPVQVTAGTSVTVFLPEAGAAVGSGNGTVEGTVRVSPSAEEVEVMRLVNEVRTKGTLNGQDAIKGSCVEATFQPNTLRPLSYSGTLAHAAIQHSIYQSQEAVGGHEETRTTSPYFYGAMPWDRFARSRALFGGPSRGVGENVLGGAESALQAMQVWMTSPGHCRNIMDEEYNVIGVGYRLNPNWEGIGYQAWTQMFGL